LHFEILNGLAYRDLSYSAAKALPYFLAKVKLSSRNPDRYKNPFEFSYAEAVRYGFSKATFRGVIQELSDKGFIDWIKRGGLRCSSMCANGFCLSERWRQYGKAGFQERSSRAA
jgi:hypothetical protein